MTRCIYLTDDPPGRSRVHARAASTYMTLLLCLTVHLAPGRRIWHASLHRCTPYRKNNPGRRERERERKKKKKDLTTRSVGKQKLRMAPKNVRALSRHGIRVAVSILNLKPKS
ncbi:hypothetical protein CLIB1423_27S00540 [[Candida] railenensis]|uniref:Uncharacterized protein n=1 Tax=[Candida] railenensis TaxID=45579 RepID=A0A9P0QUV0_9ASCO|nr:hypothetical protein CLIB1423_27S00540 [[Candida] railenensis]